MKPILKIFLIPFLLLFNRCVTEFIPQTNDNKKLLVVEGLITDQPAANTIKLSESQPLGLRNIANPVTGSFVTISDDLGNTFRLTETTAGLYVTDSANFRGVIGRFYTLHIKTNSAHNNLSYESNPMEMIAVPAIDSVYHEKITLASNYGIPSQEGCQININTHDPTNLCKFYRWEYIETWEFMLPYEVPPLQHKVCWISSNSNVINIKSTSVLEEDRISGYPLTFISNSTDRLRVKYSILVKQYSLNEDEFLYWDKIHTIGERVGGLYDIIPSSVPSNIYCLDNPDEKVLGYFSVSSTTSKRHFIKDSFAGIYTPYTDNACISDTILGDDPIPDLNNFVWLIIDHPLPPPQYRVITRFHGCYDCSLRGTTVEPDFWNDDK